MSQLAVDYHGKGVFGPRRAPIAPPATIGTHVSSADAVFEVSGSVSGAISGGGDIANLLTTTAP